MRIDLPKLKSMYIGDASLKMYQSPRSLEMRGIVFFIFSTIDLPVLETLIATKSGSYYAPLQLVYYVTFVSMKSVWLFHLSDIPSLKTLRFPSASFESVTSKTIRSI